MSENKQVFRHLTDGFVQVIFAKVFNTASRHFSDTLYTFQTPSIRTDHLTHNLKIPLETFEQLSSFHTSDQHLEKSIQSKHLRRLLQTVQTPSKTYKLTFIMETFVHASFILVRIFTNRNKIFQLGCLPNCCQTPTLQSHSQLR